MKNRAVIGFSLLELITVLLIVAVLVSLLLPVFPAAKRAANGAKSSSNMHQIATAIQIYGLDYDPPDGFAVTTPPSLVTLLQVGAITRPLLDTGSGHELAAYEQVWPNLPCTNPSAIRTWNRHIELSGENPFILLDLTQDGPLLHAPTPVLGIHKGLGCRLDGSVRVRLDYFANLLDDLSWEK